MLLLCNFKSFKTKNKMKKTLVLVGGVVFAALLAVSCGNKQAAEENAEAVE